jgi:PAS domain S-box-containing protein
MVDISLLGVSEQKIMEEISTKVEPPDLLVRDFMAYLRANCLTEVAKENIRIIRKIDTPLLKLFENLSEEQFLEQSKTGLEKFLIDFEQGKALETARKNAKLWEEDKLPGISKNDIHISDLVRVYVAQKQAIMKFISEYTSDSSTTVAIIHGLEDYYMEAQEMTLQTFTKIHTEVVERAARLQSQQEAYRFYADELNEAKNKLEIILQGVSDGITAQDPSGKLVFANDTGARLSGYPTARDLIAAPVNEIISKFRLMDEEGEPMDASELPTRQALNGKITKEKIIRFEIIETGEKHWSIVNSTPIFNEDGNVQLVINTFRDISRLKEIELENIRLYRQALQSEEQFRLLAEAIPQIVWTANPDGKTDYYNKRWFEYSGMTPEQTFALEWFTALYPEDLEGCLEKWNRSVKTGENFEMEYRLRRASDKSYRWHLCRGLPLHDSNGAITKWFGTATDIDDQKKTEEALARKTHELLLSNQELQQFSYISSHDLQEPLRIVTSYIQLLSKRYKGRLDSEADEFIHFAVEGVERMQSLINDILSYLGIGMVAEGPVSTSSEAALIRAVKNLKTIIDENNVAVTFDPLPTVKADGPQLTRLFQNLINNSVKYKGEISPQIHIGAKRLENEWLFSVSDNGIGIENQYYDRIFLLFQRLHTRMEYPGTGIGLSICKKIVEKHGGRIWVESEINKGTTIFFTWPA